MKNMILCLYLSAGTVVMMFSILSNATMKMANTSKIIFLSTPLADVIRKTYAMNVHNDATRFLQFRK